MVKSKEINKIGSEFIKKAMEKNGLNQSELARRTGVSQERISRIVNDESRISLQDFVILCSVLDVDLTKDLMSKMGKIGYIMLTLPTENLYCTDILKAQVMQLNPADESRTYPLLQVPSALQDRKASKPASTGAFIDCLSDVRQPVGIWRPIALAENCNTGRHFVQLQRELAENHCAQRLC